MEGEGGGAPSGVSAGQPGSEAGGVTPLADDVAALAAARVQRTRLRDRLVSSDEPVVAVVAPPGYGKSTLLAQWAVQRGPRVAWISCDRLHDDPLSLFTALVAAITLIEPTSTPVQELVSADADRLVGHLVGLLAVLSAPVAFVLDQLEALSSQESHEFLAAFAAAVPVGSQLVLASREEIPFPTAKMRVSRQLVELGTDDLRMTRAEASVLLAAAGIHAADEATDILVQQTEGWPAALYVAALAIRAGDTTPEHGISGDQRLMGDYLRSEVLDRIPPAQATLLVRTSILEQVNGELAEAVAGGHNAARSLGRLERRSLLVESVDDGSEWYRYHPLFRQFLQAELRTHDPELIPQLHRRAATWFEAAGRPELAIDHAYLAGDAAWFGRLVLEGMQQVWASGGIDTVERWMERLGSRSPEPHTPAMVAHGALIFALLGRPGDAERWADVAESLPVTGALPNGDTVPGTLAYLRANLCREGPATMRRDAVEALAGLGPASPYRATMVHTEGLSYLLEGDLERADASFAHAYDLSASLGSSPLSALVLAEQVLVAAEREEWTSADSLVKRALDEVAGGPYDDYWTSALVFASAARVAAHRGDMSQAREHALRASRLRPLLTYALPVVSTQVLVELARAYLALVDPAGARAALEQVRGILAQRPDLGTLASAARSLDERVSQITAATPIGASSLTAAELRLVPLLPTHLTYPEIGERLFISRHTVKTHAGSVYRKLGVSSRAEAVERIQELGLA